MLLGARHVLLALAVMAQVTSVPGKEKSFREQESPPSKEPQNPEEEETVGFGGPWVEDAHGGVQCGDGREGSPPPQRSEGGQVGPLDRGSPLRFLSRPHWILEDPACQVNLDRGDGPSPPHLLEVMGLLRSYDHGFLEAVSRSPWGAGDLETFGVCPTDPPHGLLSSLQSVGGALGRPQENHVLLLHLEEVKWEEELMKLHFKLAFHKENDIASGSSHLALLVFYRGEKTGGTSELWKKFLVGGEGLPQTQALCLSGRTQYLVFQALEISGDPIPGALSMDFSLHIKPHDSHGATLSPRDAQELLFGFDAKRFSRMTPAVVLLAPRNPTDAALPTSSFLAADGRVDTVPYLKPSGFPVFVEAEGPSFPDTVPTWMNLSVPLPMSTGHFLETLSQFAKKVLSPSGETPSFSRPHLQLDLGTMEALPHLCLNLSEKGALEELVRSEDHLVVLFPEDRQAWVEHQVAQWSLEGTLLQQLLEKLRAVIHDLETIPSVQANAGQLRALLASCYYPPGSLEEPPNSPGGPSASPGDPSSVGAQHGAQGPPSREKFHSLLLLKALQAVRANWWESRLASSRAHRRARHRDDYCQLQELRIELVSMGDIILPEAYNANNCVGSCRSPLSTRVGSYYYHTVLLLRMHEEGVPVMRPPCCVPVKYSQKIMILFKPVEGIIVKSYPDMVAESCGCR